MTDQTGEYKIALYPGTFDPITNGHMDIIKRAARMFDRLIIAVAENEDKAPLFSVEERKGLVSQDLGNLSLPNTRIEVVSFNKLLVDFAKDMEASIVVRGLRAVSDFEFEFQMTGMNARLCPEIETVFLMASDKHQFISSRFVKEVGRLNGDISDFVSPDVKSTLMDKFTATPPR